MEMRALENFSTVSRYSFQDQDVQGVSAAEVPYSKKESCMISGCECECECVVLIGAWNREAPSAFTLDLPLSALSGEEPAYPQTWRQLRRKSLR